MQRPEMERGLAVQRYRAGEDPKTICASLGKSLRWLYKWIERAETEGRDPGWFAERSRRPERIARKTPQMLADMIVATRDELQSEGLFHGAQSIY